MRRRGTGGRGVSLLIHLPGDSRARAGMVWRWGGARLVSLARHAGPEHRLAPVFPRGRSQEGGQLQIAPHGLSVSHTRYLHTDFQGTQSGLCVSGSVMGSPMVAYRGFSQRPTGPARLSLGSPTGVRGARCLCLPREAGCWAPPPGREGDRSCALSVRHTGPASRF